MPNSQTPDQAMSTPGAEPLPSQDPADASLLSVLRELEAEGYTAQFGPREGGTIHCFSCRQDFPAERCAHGDIRRLEGTSDPADMLAVIPVRCPNCEARGPLITNYGPEATLADADVLLELERVARIRGANG